MTPAQQPYLHDLVPLLSGPTQVWCSPSGDVDDGGLGVIASDTQVIGRLRLLLDGQPVTWLTRRIIGPTATWTGVVRHLQDEVVDGLDPRVVIIRTRTLRSDANCGIVEEELAISSALDRSVETMINLDVGPSLDPIDQVKADRRSIVQTSSAGESPGVVAWGDSNVAARLTTQSGVGPIHGDSGFVINQQIQLDPGETGRLLWKLEVTPSLQTPVVAARRPADTPQLMPVMDSRLKNWLDQSLADLTDLRLEHRAFPGHAFYGAGAPWYLTLFGRDSIWAARLTRTVDPSTAASTLTVLGAVQGRQVDPETEEAPGKILHEIRGAGFTTLPTRYYGTIDATALWVNLLVDLVDDRQLSEIDLRRHQTTLERALAWISGPNADPDGDGFLEYRAPSGRGLANQGWKDSTDAVRFANGELATGPIALCEVQGYAYAATTRGADLLVRLGADPGPARQWAEQLRRQFQQQFCDGVDRFPMFALDGAKRQVDATTSNIGHLLGTGILDPDQEHAVAERLCQPDMTSGLGLRTMSARDGGYHPLSYHCGSVWAHDTAIVIDGMLRAHLHDHAAMLAEQLLAAAAQFHNRLPELWSGDPDGTPYPAACHPQAWASAAAIPAIQALTPLGNVAVRR